MVKHKYAYEEAKVMARPPETEMHAYNTAEDFGRASVGIVECRGRHWRIKNPMSDRVYLVLEGEDTSTSAARRGRRRRRCPSQRTMRS